jgi:hypothetical protein
MPAVTAIDGVSEPWRIRCPPLSNPTQYPTVPQDVVAVGKVMSALLEAEVTPDVLVAAEVQTGVSSLYSPAETSAPPEVVSPGSVTNSPIFVTRPRK